MTPDEKKTQEKYGTAYPCCGNCISIRQAGFKLMCDKYKKFRDFDSIKCGEYQYKEYIPIYLG